MARRGDIQIINESRDFQVHELFFSTTNEKGVIEFGNEVFVRISGYSEADVVGAAHSIVRHPDMPRGVFQLFWQKLQAGEPIAAYVKNLAQDGRYYWVLAVATPCKNGYLSVRLKPTSGLLKEVIRIYAEMRKIEDEVAANEGREEAMVASRARLLEMLAELGYANYESFMRNALSVEMSSRRALLADGVVAAPARVACSREDSNIYRNLLVLNRQVDEHLNTLFGRLDDFKAVNQSLLKNSEEMLSCASNIQMLAINATVAAKRVAGKAATLDVVAQSLGDSSSETQTIINEMLDTTGRLVVSIDTLIFEVATVKLQTEVTLTFLEEIVSGLTQDSAALRSSLQILQSEIVCRSARVYEQLASVNRSFLELREVMLALHRNNQTLRFVQISGKKETATIDAATDFGFLLRDVETEIYKTEAEGKHLRACVSDGVEYVQALLQRQHVAKRDIDSIQQRLNSRWDADALATC